MKSSFSHNPVNDSPSSHIRKPRRDRGSLIWYLYIAPTVLVMAFVFGYPIVSVIRYSFYSGNINRLVFVGWTNYKSIFQDQVFLTSLKNNLLFLICVPIMIVFALMLSIILYEAVKGWKFYRSVVFLPYIISATVIGITFSFLYQYNGVVNTTLRSLGLNSLAHDWLGSATYVVPSIMSVIIYQQLGFGVVLFLARLLNLPADVFEAAELDGVTWWQKQWHITIPQLKGVLEFFAITEVINMLSWVFNYVYVLTSGGPGNSSSVLEIYIWRNAFFFHSYGIASAVATLLMFVSVVLIFFYFRIRKNSTKEGGAL
jgi:ABC-type sugar transport system permease subunit